MAMPRHSASDALPDQLATADRSRPAADGISRDHRPPPTDRRPREVEAGHREGPIGRHRREAAGGGATAPTEWNGESLRIAPFGTTHMEDIAH